MLENKGTWLISFHFRTFNTSYKPGIFNLECSGLMKIVLLDNFNFNFFFFHCDYIYSYS